MKTRFTAAAAALLLSTSIAASADAATVAVFGQNSIGSLYSAAHTVTYVSDAQLATAGFLTSFDAFVYTRDGTSFGQTLSVAAAANVKSFVTGNVVLFAGDFNDDIGQTTTNTIFNNALSYVLGGNGKGYIGEFNGAMAAYATNADGYNAIGLVQGAAGTLGQGQGGSDGDVSETAIGAMHPVLANVPLPYNPAAVEFGFDQTGFNPNAVIAQFDNGNPAILAASIGGISAGVPEPATWALMILGMGAVGGAMRRRAATKTTVRFA